MNSLFTLAGAFSMFRREVILRTSLYSKQTVSEDTHLTFHLHQTLGKDYRISCLADVVAYVGPTETLAELYAQRVRWQRGQIEVVALYPRLVRRSPFAVRGLAPSRTLLVDHTLAFPRVIWTFLLPLLYFFGYSLDLVASAMVGMYGCYAAVEGLSAAVSYLLSDESVRERIRQHWWIFLIMPGYRFLLFWFRFGGFVSVFNEPAVWRTTAPWSDTRRGLIKARDTLQVTFLHLKRTVGIA